MAEQEQTTLRLNEWIPREGYSYLLYWPYEGLPDPENEIIDYYVRIKRRKKRVGSFDTLGAIAETLSRDTYVSHDTTTVIIRRLSHDLIEKAIEALIENGELKYKTEIAKSSPE